MDKGRDERTEKHSKVTVTKTVTKEIGGTKSTGGSDKVDGTHYTVKKTTSEGDK